MDDQNGTPAWVKFAPIMAMAAYAWAAIFIRWAEEASPLVIAFYRMFFTTLVWLPLYWWKRPRDRSKPRHRASRRQKWLMVLAGLLLCFHFATWISSLAYTTVASAVFLILTQPVMVAVAAHFILQERLNRWNVGAMLLTVVGSLLIFGGDMELGREHLFGDFLALVGAAGAAGYLFIARVARPDRREGEPGVPLNRYLPPVYATATLGLFVVCLVSGQDFGPFSAQTWGALIALALVPTVIGHSLFNFSLRYLPALHVNIAIVGEPVGASILAYVLLNEVPSTGLLIGSPLLVLAVVVVLLRPPGSGRVGRVRAPVPPDVEEFRGEYRSE